jgi:hypothetical protein
VHLQSRTGTSALQAVVAAVRGAGRAAHVESAVWASLAAHLRGDDAGRRFAAAALVHDLVVDSPPLKAQVRHSLSGEREVQGGTVAKSRFLGRSFLRVARSESLPDYRRDVSPATRRGCAPSSPHQAAQAPGLASALLQVVARSADGVHGSDDANAASGAATALSKLFTAAPQQVVCPKHSAAPCARSVPDPSARDGGLLACPGSRTTPALIRVATLPPPAPCRLRRRCWPPPCPRAFCFLAPTRSTSCAARSRPARPS